MNEVSPEIFIAMIGAGGVLLGTILSGIITYFTNLHNNKREDERFNQKLKHEELQLKSEEDKFEQQLQHENNQQLRKYNMNRLHKLLIPIIEIYEKENRLLDDLAMTSSIEIMGEGIQHSASKEIEKIITENKIYISVDLLKAYSEVKADYEDTMIYDHIQSKIFHLERKGEQVAPFLFDGKKKFINRIEKEAKLIESKYT